MICVCERCINTALGKESACLSVTLGSHEEVNKASSCWLKMDTCALHSTLLLQIPHVEWWWLKWLEHIFHMSPVSETDSQPVHWLDNGWGPPLREAKRIIGWANPIKLRSSRWMIKQAEGCSGQSANNQPFKWVLCKWSIMNASKQPYENDAQGECGYRCVSVHVHSWSM